MKIQAGRDSLWGTNKQMTNRVKIQATEIVNSQEQRAKGNKKKNSNIKDKLQKLRMASK